MEIKIHSYIRWNAMAMVVRANKDTNVGGHIASFASAAALYDVGFSHFWRSLNDPRRRPDLLPGPFRAGRLFPRFHAGSPDAKSRWTTSARKPAARVFRPTRTRG
jgi:pyruvate dehydrogenase complex dehydrogenase (E1) component